MATETPETKSCEQQSSRRCGRRGQRPAAHWVAEINPRCRIANFVVPARNHPWCIPFSPWIIFPPHCSVDMGNHDTWHLRNKHNKYWVTWKKNSKFLSNVNVSIQSDIYFNQKKSLHGWETAPEKGKTPGVRDLQQCRSAMLSWRIANLPKVWAGAWVWAVPQGTHTSSVGNQQSLKEHKTKPRKTLSLDKWKKNEISPKLVTTGTYQRKNTINSPPNCSFIWGGFRGQ